MMGVAGAEKLPTISVMVDWRGGANPAPDAFSSTFCRLRGAAVDPVDFSLGSRGFRAFFSFALPSSNAFASGSTSFFLRCRLGLSAAVDIAPVPGPFAALPIAGTPAACACAGSPEAGRGTTWPPTAATAGDEVGGGGCATRIVSA